MINVMSYIGMSLQSEVCLWTLLGLVRTIFDATLFKVNANLKQVWQMNMPPELSLPVQRVLRTMISGVMLVQCFTLYVYLASYIVLLYPVFLEERPTLVLPWLLLAAIRNLLCELTSLALGLGTCVLLGPARPPCVKFLISKVSSIMPAFYMWLLILSYYDTLKMASAFKTFVTLPSSNHDYGLELAVRRRRTKSLFGEEALRRKLMASLYGERHSVISAQIPELNKIEPSKSLLVNSSNIIKEDKATIESDIFPLLRLSNTRLNTACSEEWPISEVTMPRDTDRILEQFGLMMLRIAAYVHEEGADQMNFLSPISTTAHQSNIEQTLPTDTIDSDVPSLKDGNSRVGTVTYLQEYPEIFMKKPEVLINLNSEPNISTKETAREMNVEGTNKKGSVRKVSKTIKTHSVDVENSNKRNTNRFEDSLLIESGNMLRPRFKTKSNKYVSDNNEKVNKSSHISSTSDDSIKSFLINFRDENKNKTNKQFSKCVGTNSQKCCDACVESSNSNIELFKFNEKYITASSSETSLSRTIKICSTCHENSNGDEHNIETEEMLSTSKNNVTSSKSNYKRNIVRNKADGNNLKSEKNKFKICDICYDSNSSNSESVHSSTNDIHERNNS